MEYSIANSPFRWSETDKEYEFIVEVPDSDQVIDGCVFVSAVIVSLLDDEGDCEIVVCGCGDGRCAGFFDEHFVKTAELVIWKLRYHGVQYAFKFDRRQYERDAIAMLKDMVNKNIGWNDFAVDQYRDLEAFKADVERAIVHCGMKK